MQDSKAKVLRLIGKPSIRLREDPVRILRALRISNKIGFRIDEATYKTMPKFIPLLSEIAGGRLFDEYQKLFLHGDGLKNFASLKQLGILPYLFPHLEQTLQNSKAARMIELALKNTDARIQAGKTINAAFLVAVLLWQTLIDRQVVLRQHKSPREAYANAVAEVLKEQLKITNMPGHLPEFIQQVWGLQRQLERPVRSKVLSILTHPRYRAAYDFLVLRGEVGEVDLAVCSWWNDLYDMTEADRLVAVEAL